MGGGVAKCSRERALRNLTGRVAFQKGAIALEGVRGILIRAEDVAMVEMMRKVANPSEDGNNGRQEGTDATAEKPWRI
jgi:hypothetical protein